MTSVDDIATPMEMMMEDTKNIKEPSITPEKKIPEAPASPVAQGIKRLSDLMQPPQSPLSALLASPHQHSPKRVSFGVNPVSPSPRRSSYQSNKKRRGSPFKPTIPLNVSLFDRPTKAWLAKHGQLPGQKDVMVPNSNGKRYGDTLFPMDHNKRHKRWHCTVPAESVPNRPTKSWLAKVEGNRAIHHRLELKHRGANDPGTACPFLESADTLHTPNGQFFHYGDHQYP